MIEWRYPSQGELALVLNYGSGDRNTARLRWSASPLTNSLSHPVIRTRLSERSAPLAWRCGTRRQESSRSRRQAALSSLPTLVHSTGELSDATRSMSEDREIYNGHDHPHGEPTVGKPNQKQ